MTHHNDSPTEPRVVLLLMIAITQSSEYYTDIVEDFAIKHPRRMKLVNILNSDDYLMCITNLMSVMTNKYVTLINVNI